MDVAEAFGESSVFIASSSARNPRRREYSSNSSKSLTMRSRRVLLDVEIRIILGGIPREILDRLVNRGLAEAPTICAPKSTDIPAGTCSRYWLVFDPEGMKKILDELVQEAGVKVLFDTRAVAPIIDDQTIRGVIIESKSGRSLSATHEALASVRMMPSCMAMGQAAGTAAAMSIETKTAPRQIDTHKLRAALEEQGVML